MNDENRLIIKQLNKFGRVLETSELLKMIEVLENNWNELKKWLEEESKLKGSETAYLYYGNVLEKMQELENGNNDSKRYV